jgi:hypothetical protein
MLDMTMPIYAEARRLSATTDQKYHVDHVESLAGGGAHHHLNLEIVSKTWNLTKAARENTEILAAIYRGDPVPLLPEAVGLIYDDIEATTVEAALAGVTTPARSTLEGLLRVLTLSENAPCFSVPAVGKLIADLRADINDHIKDLSNVV